MTPAEAEDLAARTLAAIDALWPDAVGYRLHLRADRERLASDLAMIRFYDGDDPRAWLDYAVTNLRRTAALYGVQP